MDALDGEYLLVAEYDAIAAYLPEGEETAAEARRPVYAVEDVHAYVNLFAIDLVDLPQGVDGSHPSLVFVVDYVVLRLEARR